MPEHESAGTLHLEVLQRHLIQFSINEGPTQRMVPLMFGSHSTAAFEPESDVHLPTFEEVVELSEVPTQPYTPWLIVQRNPAGETKWGYGFSGLFPHWAQAFNRINYIWYNFIYYDFFPHTVQSTVIDCRREIDLAAFFSLPFEDPGNDPLCLAWTFGAFHPPRGASVFHAHRQYGRPPFHGRFRGWLGYGRVPPGVRLICIPGHRAQSTRRLETMRL